MEIFKRKRKADDLPPLWGAGELEELMPGPSGANYESVLEWLVGLSDEEYKQVCEVSLIYRRADQEASATLGADAKPTTFINPPKVEAPEPAVHEDFLSDDDELSTAFLEDEPKPKTKRKSAKS